MSFSKTSIVGILDEVPDPLRKIYGCISMSVHQLLLALCSPKCSLLKQILEKPERQEICEFLLAEYTHPIP